MLFLIFRYIFLWPFARSSMGDILSNGIAESKDVSVNMLIDTLKLLSIKIAQKLPPSVPASPGPNQRWVLPALLGLLKL